jgi:DNA-binding FadR family transcriptional regulator
MFRAAFGKLRDVLDGAGHPSQGGPPVRPIRWRVPDAVSLPFLRPVRGKTLDTAVLDILADFVAKRRYGPGDRLPAERELVEVLGVSRATVREALKRWEGLGIVEMRKGSGTYLKTAIGPGALHLAPLTIARPTEREAAVASLLHLLEIRRALEGEAAAVCARRASADQVAQIRLKLEIMEATHLKYGDAPEQDWEFHQAIFRATANPIFEQVVGSMRDAFHRFWENPLDMPDFARRTFPLHRVMYDAIAARKPEEARAAALRIIDIVEEDIRDAAARQGRTE